MPPATKLRKIGQLSAAPTNSEPVVMTFGRRSADPAAAKPGDDRREQRQEDDQEDWIISRASG